MSSQQSHHLGTQHQRLRQQKLSEHHAQPNDAAKRIISWLIHVNIVNDHVTNDFNTVDNNGIESNNHGELENRRSFLRYGLIASGSILTTSVNQPVEALVKGNAPPSKMSPSDRPKCTNIDECQAISEQRERDMIASQQQQDQTDTSIMTTSKGTRYRDYTKPTGTQEAKVGDEVSLYYKVLKLGKRSYDGLSGEGTVVFSKGYGYNDDEVQERQQTYITTVGSYYNIEALNDVLTNNMRIGTVRRFSVLPDQGWRKPGKLCDGGPGGSGTGGELRTDYVVVPTATMVDAEKCFDNTKQPFPTQYAQQRRMAQRFDQSLIMEIELVSIKGNNS